MVQQHKREISRPTNTREDSHINPRKPSYPGVARLSKSVFCKKEPRNTKFILAEIISHVFDLISARCNPLTFVQAGANDGVHADAIGAHVIRHGWRGMLIEPVPAAMERLRANYGPRDGLVFRTEAIWPDEEMRDFYMVRGEDVLSSFSLDTIMKHAPKYDDLPGMIETIQVPTRRLDTLCRETGFITPDVLAVDVEGLDDIILRTFDFDHHRPLAILFEHVHLSAGASEDIGTFLTGHGYVIIHDRHDCLCLQPDALAAGEVDFLARLITAAREN